MDKISALLFISFTILAGCGPQENVLIGKWQAEDVASNPESIQDAIQKPNLSGGVIEFTEKEYISPFGSRTPVDYEIVSDKEIVAYQTVMGSRIGETFELSNKNALVTRQGGRTFVFHRIN